MIDARALSDELGCTLALAHDLLVLAGGDEDLVREASKTVNSGVDSLKNYIINKRFEKLERKY